MSGARSIGRASRAPLVALLLGSAGCATLQSVPEPAEFLTRATPDVVYVTFRNQSKVTLSQPRVSGDTLFGQVPGVSSPVAALLSHIQTVEALQRDRQRTTWLIAGMGALTAAALAVLVTGGGGEAGVHPCDLEHEDCDYGSYDVGR